MSFPFNQIYEFGDFRLDAREKTLTRGGEPILITPKGFELLTFFVENPGRLLGKEEILETIWAGSFVEESNLTFNIRQLRVVLGDDAHQPKYIKTVRRHGYRFIADVRRGAAENEPENFEINASALEPPEAPPASPAPPAKRPPRTALFVFAVILVATVGAGAWYAHRVFRQHGTVLTAPFVAEKLSTNGRNKFTALSPDGKSLVYTNRKANGTEGIWLRRLETGENVELIPAAEANHYDLQFSPDGATLFYSSVPWQAGEANGIYRVSMAGGAPEKIAGDIFGRLGVSPDGAHVTYNRCPRREDEYCAVWIADADGQNERKLITRAAGLYVGDTDFSPDGKQIAFTVGQARNKANEFGVWTIDLATGAERELTAERFYVITSLAWLPDASGLLLTAFKFPDNNFRIWQISADGAATALTNVAEHYEFLSIDRAASQVAAIQVQENYELRLVDLENPSDVRFLTDAGSAAFAPDGKIYFSSTMSGNHEIWSIQPDGTNRRQLTNSKDEEYYPVAAPDGNLIYFASTRSGAAQVWRMKPDGTEQTQVTFKAGGFPLSVTANGEWLYYLHGVDRTLWRVALGSGEEQLVLNRQNWIGFGTVQNWAGFGVSPDGARAAYPDKQGDENVLAVAQIPGGEIVRTFRLPDKKMVPQQIGWTPDGAALLYLSLDEKFENLVLWKQPFGGGAAPEQLAALGSKSVSGYNLPVAADGKTLAAVQQETLSDVVLLKGLR